MEKVKPASAKERRQRYFLIIDDLWATSVWHVARRAFPEGNGSRIVTTTEIQDVALACCSYESQYMFKMERLSLSHSKELFISAVFGSGEQHSRQLDGVSNEIIRRCAGLPQAIISICSVLASLGEANTKQNREKIQNNLPTNATSDEILKQVLIFCYNCLPSCLQTCLLYLSIYPENYIILKEVIMKQWVAEGFICAPTENEKMKVAESYFDKLVHMGMIQQIDVDYSDEVLYYAVHHMVHDIITTKSIEENFVTVIDYSQRTVRFSNKVRRLSLQFGSATYATSPESIGLSQIQSLAFIGLKSCYYSSILEFKVLRVLILHIWADEPSTGVDLKPTSELVLLRSLQVTCNDTVHLPDLMQGPKHLETLEINARVAAIPANIVHLRSWLHLRLGVGTEVPDLTGTLKIETLNPPLSLDDSSCSCKSGKTMELLSPICSCKSVKTVELLSPICRVPKWIGHLTNLCILKFVVRELQRDDISNLQKLSFLSVLSLHVQQPTTGLIGFAPGAFSALEYFEFRCGVLRLMFQEGTMPNLQRLKLGFNAHPRDGFLLVGVEDLLSVKEISGVIGLTAGAVESDFMAAESVFRKAMGRHLNFSVEREELYVDAEKQQDYQTEIKQHSSSDSQLIKRSGPTELIIDGEGDMHKLDQVLVSNKETGLEKLTLERCPPLELKHLLMLTTLKPLIVNDSDGQLGGQGDVEWQLPVWCPKLQELKISNCPEFSSVIPISWIESLRHVTMKHVKLLEEFTYSNSSDGAELEIIGEDDLHSLDQVLVFDKETSLEKLTLEMCPPLGLKHLLMLKSLKTLIVKYSDDMVGPLGGQGNVEWRLLFWFPKLQELEISNCPEFSSLIPMSWIESLHRVTMKHVKLLEEFTYSSSSDGAELEIIGEDDLHSLDQVLVFDKETSLEKLTLERCPPLELKHLLMLTSLKKLFVKDSDSLVGPLGGQGDVEWQLPVEHIKIQGLNGNSGKELTELLPHLAKLSKLEIWKCKNIKKLVVGEDVQQTTSEALEMGGGEITASAEESTELLPFCWDFMFCFLTELFAKLSKLVIWMCRNIKKLVVGVDVQQTTSEASEMGEDEITAVEEDEDDGVLLFPAHLCDSLQELEFIYCNQHLFLEEDEITAVEEDEDDGILVEPLTLVPRGGGLQVLRSLQRLTLNHTPKFLSAFSFSCDLFPSSLQFLELRDVEGMGTLEPLSNLSSLTTLKLGFCGKDLKCEGLQSLLTTGGQLNELEVIGNPGFFAGWDPNPKQDLEDVEEQQTQLVSSTLRELYTDDAAGLLSAPICSFLSSSLTKLKLDGSEGMERFSREQEDALQLLSSLQELEFSYFHDLQQLPAGLCNLTRLRKLAIYYCPAISSLPNDGLPESLQELDVRSCRNEELKQQCRGLVGTIPKIIID